MQATLRNAEDPRGLGDGRPALHAVPPPMLKSRYRIREVDGARQLTCVEAPTIATDSAFNMFCSVI